MACYMNKKSTICIYLLRIFIAACFFLMAKLSITYIFDLHANDPPQNVKLDLAVLNKSKLQLSLYPLLVALISSFGFYIYVTNARGFKGTSFHLFVSIIDEQS